MHISVYKFDANFISKYSNQTNASIFKIQDSKLDENSSEENKMVIKTKQNKNVFVESYV